MIKETPTVTEYTFIHVLAFTGSIGLHCMCLCIYIKLHDLSSHNLTCSYTLIQSTKRTVTIARTKGDYGFKMIGGNAVGLFIIEIHPFVKNVMPGDQILKVNGQDTRHMTHFEASEILKSSEIATLEVTKNIARTLYASEGGGIITYLTCYTGSMCTHFADRASIL